MVTASPVRIDRGRVAELTEREQKKLDARTTKSGEMYERARRSLSGGVASSYQVRDPWPIYLEKGHGSKVWDVDGTEMVDFHNGFGRWCRDMPTRPSSRPCSGRSRGARTSRRRSKTPSSSARSWCAASASRSGATSTRAPRRRWMPSASPAPSPDATRSSRSSAPTTATTTT